jgi:hypothetical protein
MKNIYNKYKYKPLHQTTTHNLKRCFPLIRNHNLNRNLDMCLAKLIPLTPMVDIRALSSNKINSTLFLRSNFNNRCTISESLQTQTNLLRFPSRLIKVELHKYNYI